MSQGQNMKQTARKKQTLTIVPESKLKKPFQGMLDGEKEPYSPMELVINSKKRVR